MPEIMQQADAAVEARILKAHPGAVVTREGGRCKAVVGDAVFFARSMLDLEDVLERSLPGGGRA